MSRMLIAYAYRTLSHKCVLERLDDGVSEHRFDHIIVIQAIFRNTRYL